MKKHWIQFVLLLGLSAGLQAAVYSRPLLLSAKFPTANTYTIAYFDFLSGAAQAIPSNAFLEYDVFVPADSADFDGGIDLGGNGAGTIGDLRDFTTSSGNYIKDQNNLRAHPYSDLSLYAKGQWYHRKFDMGAAGAKTFKEACLSTDTGNGQNGASDNLAGYYNGYFDNVQYTNAYGATLVNLFSNASSLSMTGSPISGTYQFGYAGAGASTNNLVAVSDTLTLSAAAPTVVVGNPMTITVNLSGGGVAIPGANVRLSVGRSQDTLSSVVGVTDASGNVQVTVTSTLAGSSQVDVVAGPFSASTTFTFVAGAAASWNLGTVLAQNFNIGNSGTALQVSARGILNNVTTTSRSVVVSATDTFLQLSTDDATWVAAGTGITLTPATGAVTFYARNNGGAYRGISLKATDSVAAGALAPSAAAVVVNPNAAAGLQLALQATGQVGSDVQLNATAVDAGDSPTASTAVVSLSSASPSGMFSQDNGFSWASVTSVALVAGSAALLYRDTKSGVSQALGSSVLGSASTSITLGAGAPYAISGLANPAAVYNNSANGPNDSTLTATVLDVYGNPVSNTAVSWVSSGSAAGTLSLASSNTNASGNASSIYTVNAGASSYNYIRASVAGIKPTTINVSASLATRLNLSPNPATGGVEVPTSFIVLAQNNASPAVTGASTASVSISSTTGTLSFSPDASTWSSTLTLTLSSGAAQFYAKDSLSTGLTGATITATDTSGALSPGSALLVIFPAAIRVSQVAAVANNVSRNETGLSVSMTVVNSGGTDANLNASTANTYLTFGGSAANYTITPSPSNPTVVPAGGSAILQFDVSVGASAALGSTVVDGHVSGTDAVTGAVLNDGGGTAITHTWVVAGPATQLRVYTPGGSPVAGAPFSVSVVALDASGNTATIYSQPLVVSTELIASPGVTATGQVNISNPSFAGGLAVYSSDYTLTQGVYLNAYSAGLSANSVGLTPVAAALNRYRVYNPSSAFVGQAFSVTISAMDQYGNTRAGATAVTLTPQGGAGVLAVAWKNMSTGLQSFFNEAYNLSQSIQIFANDGGVTSVLAETTPIALLSYTYTDTRTLTPTPTFTATVSPSFSTSPSYTTTPTITLSWTISPTWSASPTQSQTWTISPTFSISGTYSQTPTLTITPTQTSTVTLTGSGTPSDSATQTPTGTASPTVTLSAAASGTVTQTPSPTFSATPSGSQTPTISPSFSVSPTWSASPSFSASPTITLSGTISPTWSVSPSFSASPSITVSFSPSPTSTTTPTASSTPSSTATPSPTATETATSSESATLTQSSTPSDSSTATPSSTQTPSWTVSPTFSVTETFSASPTITETFTVSPTPSESPTASPTGTAVVNVAVARPRPNPFWPLKGQRMYLDIDVADQGTVRVRAFNLAGELVETIFEGERGNGRSTVSWDGRNSLGDPVASGVYVILVQAPGGLQTSFLVGVLK
jgi:hypothetical protein